MAHCQTRSEFLIRAIRLGIDPDQLVSICRTHCLGMGFGDWDAQPATVQDVVAEDLIERIEMLHRAGLVLVDASRLHELERAAQTLQHLGALAIERMQSY